MVGIRTGRLELGELWAYVAKKQRRVKPHEAFDAALADVMAGEYGKAPGKIGRPKGMFKSKVDKAPVAVANGRKLYRPPMIG